MKITGTYRTSRLPLDLQIKDIKLQFRRKRENGYLYKGKAHNRKEAAMNKSKFYKNIEKLDRNKYIYRHKQDVVRNEYKKWAYANMQIL